LKELTRFVKTVGPLLRKQLDHLEILTLIIVTLIIVMTWLE